MTTSIAPWRTKSPGVAAQADRIISEIVRKRSKRVAPFNARRTYAAAAQNRLTADWTATGASADTELWGALETLRNRARQLCRDNDYAKGFLNLLKTQVIGSKGIGLKMDVTDRIKKGAEWEYKSDDYANDLIAEAWDEFSKPGNFTVTGELSRQDCENLIVTTAARDGEFIARIIEGWDENKFRFALQFFEAEQLDHTLNDRAPNGNTIRMGAELNAWRRPVAYWLLSENPGDYFFMNRPGKKYQRFPAREIIHGFIPSYFQQTRGESWFHTASRRLNMLDGYEESTLVHARASAAKMGFFVSDDPNGDYKGDDVDADGNLISELEPGAMERLPHGVKFQAADMSGPDAEFGEFCKKILRGVATGLNASYNSLAGDLESVNYSSLREGKLAEREVWMMIQSWIVTKFHSRIFPLWLDSSLMAGVIGNLPVTKFDKFNAPVWMPRRWSWVDPVKDVAAAQAAVDLGIRSRTSIINEQCLGDFETVVREQGKEVTLAKKHGVQLGQPKPSAPPTAKPAKEASADDGDADE